MTKEQKQAILMAAVRTLERMTGSVILIISAESDDGRVYCTSVTSAPPEIERDILTRSANRFDKVEPSNN
jgi:hypothetical protein